MVEYTQPQSAKQHILSAINQGVSVLIGTSGLTNNDYAEISHQALQQNTTVLAVGNFAITVVLLQKFAVMATKYLKDFEIIDYAGPQKKDNPSGTARELAHKLNQLTTTNKSHDPFRGGLVNDVNVHSIRLPGHVLGIEAIFGAENETLSIRHDSGNSAEPYVKGALLAISKLPTLEGFNRGLECVLGFD